WWRSRTSSRCSSSKPCTSPYSCQHSGEAFLRGSGGKPLAGNCSPQPGQVVEPLMATRLAPASSRCPGMASARCVALPGAAHASMTPVQNRPKLGNTLLAHLARTDSVQLQGADAPHLLTY